MTSLPDQSNRTVLLAEDSAADRIRVGVAGASKRQIEPADLRILSVRSEGDKKTHASTPRAAESLRRARSTSALPG